jgi:hypothetical protein
MNEWFENEFPWFSDWRESGHDEVGFCSCFSKHDFSNPPAASITLNKWMCLILQSGHLFTVQCSNSNCMRSLNPDEISALKEMSELERFGYIFLLFLEEKVPHINIPHGIRGTCAQY